MNCDCECCVLLAALLRARRDRHEDLADAPDEPKKTLASVSIHFKAIYKALSEGPKVELEKIIGKQSPCFVRVLEEGPFEHVDDGTRYGKWQLKA